ncbi:MAG: hypothetical protein CMB10_06070 [Euryarchaeota archaeon]|nr:hypothetical protein [Euryarchaeota archaeon]|tara:strand:- start:6807 stop:7970 length:1164 start_codon:yes stop_codon:yes gene_type:complete
MEEASWWPRGLALGSIDDALSNQELTTKWGKLSCFDVRETMEPSWWNKQDNGCWGSFSKLKIESVKVIHQQGNHTFLHLDEAYTALVYSIPTSDSTSMLTRKSAWATALESTSILLPVAGMTIEGNDAVVVFPRFDLTSDADIEWISTSLGLAQASLEPFSTPNDQNRWNQRLKSVEDALRPNTLWRAPHTKHTVGLPALRIHPSWVGMTDGEMKLIPMNQRVSEHLLCGAERLPALAELIQMEGRWVEMNGYSRTDIESMLGAWSSSTPSSWSNKKALSTVLGGAWIWRYYDVLFSYAEAVLYDDKKGLESAKSWLKDVTRLQAHLGVLRVWKSGVWVGITTMIVAYYGWQIESMTPSFAIGVALAGALLSFASNRMYWWKDPSPI